MKVAELRQLLKDRGLAVSGIKAQLVKRLETGRVGRKIVGNKPWKKAAVLKGENWKEDEDNNDEHDNRNDSRSRGGSDVNLEEDLAGLGSVKDDGLDDLAGIVDQLKTGEGGKAYEKKLGKRYNEQKDLNTPPSNLVFAAEGDEDDDDGWNDDDDEDEGFNPNQTTGVPQYEPKKKRDGAPQYEKPTKSKDDATFKEDFQGTRVFVQGLPKDADWKDLKDHFKVAGEVVYASVSIDKRTGASKQCGIVQFETSSMAQHAISEMRNHPMAGEKLFVRKDVQESRNGSNSRGTSVNDERYRRANERSEYRNDDLPTEWKRANDPVEDGAGKDWYDLKEEELEEIETLIEKRDQWRRQRNYKMSDQIRYELKDDFGIHLDDRLKLWWTDTKHGGVPGVVSEIKGEGRWGKQKQWTQIPTTAESDAMVDADHVMDLLEKRDRARKRKDFRVADELLQKAHDAPGGSLGLRIHDESRTWRIWTDRPPPRKGETPEGYEKLSPVEMCLQMVTEHEPEKLDEMKSLLKKFPGREWNIMKKLKDRYNADR